MCVSVARNTLSKRVHTIELVNVAGTATIIHQMSPVRKSLPLPRTKLLTSLPSSSATYKLMSVRNTKKKLWLINSRNSLLLQPGITMRNNCNRFLKNSLFSSTFLLVAPPPAAKIPVACCRISACRFAAAFCSDMAFRMRFMRATKRVM